MAKGTSYYYFRVRRPNPTETVPYAIKVSSLFIDDKIMLNFKEMTAEQKAFYIENPTATVMEVWNCSLNAPYVPPAPDLEEYIEQKRKELKDACYDSVNTTSLEYAMAMDKVNNLTAECYYNISQARQILNDFRSQSKKAMQIKDTYILQIQNATSIKEVDELYNEAIGKL